MHEFFLPANDGNVGKRQRKKLLIPENQSAWLVGSAVSGCNGGCPSIRGLRRHYSLCVGRVCSTHGDRWFSKKKMPKLDCDWTALFPTFRREQLYFALGPMKRPIAPSTAAPSHHPHRVAASASGTVPSATRGALVDDGQYCLGGRPECRRSLKRSTSDYVVVGMDKSYILGRME